MEGVCCVVYCLIGDVVGGFVLFVAIRDTRRDDFFGCVILRVVCFGWVVECEWNGIGGGVVSL